MAKVTEADLASLTDDQLMASFYECARTHREYVELSDRQAADMAVRWADAILDEARLRAEVAAAEWDAPGDVPAV